MQATDCRPTRSPLERIWAGAPGEASINESSRLLVGAGSGSPRFRHSVRSMTRESEVPVDVSDSACTFNAALTWEPRNADCASETARFNASTCSACPRRNWSSAAAMAASRIAVSAARDMPVKIVWRTLQLPWYISFATSCPLRKDTNVLRSNAIY